MEKIITLKDKITQEPIYPITKIQAIIAENGSKLEEILNQKFLDIEQSLQSAILQAQAAEDSINTLTGLEELGTVEQTLNELTQQIENNRLNIVNLLNKYQDLKNKIKNTINRENVDTEVTGEVGKIPTSMAVRNFVTKKAEKILGNLIETTTIEPNFIPKEKGKILINTEKGEVFISPGTNKWYKINATVLELPEPIIETQVNDGILEISGDVEIENNKTLDIPNYGKVENDTLIL